jgi:hypothetical protein
MKREMRGRRVSSDERLGMGAKLGRYISIRPLLYTSVISSSISIILLGAMIKTKAQQPHASTDVAPTMGGLWSRPPGCTACGSWPLGNHEETAQNARSQERLPTNCGAKDGRWCCAGCASTAGVGTLEKHALHTEKSDPDAETLNRPDSARDVSISLSAYAFCQGELGATDLSRIHLARFGA